MKLLYNNTYIEDIRQALDNKKNDFLPHKLSKWEDDSLRKDMVNSLLDSFTQYLYGWYSEEILFHGRKKPLDVDNFDIDCNIRKILGLNKTKSGNDSTGWWDCGCKWTSKTKMFADKYNQKREYHITCSCNQPMCIRCEGALRWRREARIRHILKSRHPVEDRKTMDCFYFTCPWRDAMYNVFHFRDLFSECFNRVRARKVHSSSRKRIYFKGLLDYHCNLSAETVDGKLNFSCKIIVYGDSERRKELFEELKSNITYDYAHMERDRDEAIAWHLDKEKVPIDSEWFLMQTFLMKSKKLLYSGSRQFKKDNENTEDGSNSEIKDISNLNPANSELDEENSLIEDSDDYGKEIDGDWDTDVTLDDLYYEDEDGNIITPLNVIDEYDLNSDGNSDVQNPASWLGMVVLPYRDPKNPNDNLLDLAHRLVRQYRTFPSCNHGTKEEKKAFEIILDDQKIKLYQDAAKEAKVPVNIHWTIKELLLKMTLTANKNINPHTLSRWKYVKRAEKYGLKINQLIDIAKRWREAVIKRQRFRRGVEALNKDSD